MNKKVLVLAVAFVAVAGLLSASLPLANATPPTQISGRWVGTSVPAFSNVKVAGGNVFSDVYNKGAYVLGDISGTFEQTFTVVVHYGNPEIIKNIPDPTLRPEAPFNWIDMDRVFTGKVLGVSGGFTMRLQAKGFGNSMKGMGYFDLEGTWVIISGTGGLANLHGQGTWWHSRTGFAGLEYEGQVHFDP